jgi:uncharacterized protein (DUF488 family)
MATGSSLRKPRGGGVFSIGYEGRSVEELVNALTASKVRLLIDVRENAVSRKPGFSKRRLTDALRQAGIEYRHEPLLGNPKTNRERFRSGNLDVGRRRYLAHLNNGSRSAFDALVDEALTRRLAVLCFERDESRCHRSCITDQAQEENPALSVIRL